MKAKIATVFAFHWRLDSLNLCYWANIFHFQINHFVFVFWLHTDVLLLRIIFISNKTHSRLIFNDLAERFERQWTPMNVIDSKIHFVQTNAMCSLQMPFNWFSRNRSQRFKFCSSFVFVHRQKLCNRIFWNSGLIFPWFQKNGCKVFPKQKWKCFRYNYFVRECNELQSWETKTEDNIIKTLLFVFAGNIA